MANIRLSVSRISAGWHGCPEQLVGIAGDLAIDAQQRAVTAGLVDTGGGGTIAFALTRHL
jgi:hypothetical protein